METETRVARSATGRTELGLAAAGAGAGAVAVPSLEGSPHHPAVEGLRGPPVAHQRHGWLILGAGQQAAQLGHLPGRGTGVRRQRTERTRAARAQQSRGPLACEDLPGRPSPEHLQPPPERRGPALGPHRLAWFRTGPPCPRIKSFPAEFRNNEVRLRGQCEPCAISADNTLAWSSSDAFME